MLVVPSTFVDVISVTPAMRPKRRSSGVATDEAMVSGLAPGRLAEMEIVGKSTRGRGETGNKVYAQVPAKSTPIASNVVAMGRRMNGPAMFPPSGLTKRVMSLPELAQTGSTRRPRACFATGNDPGDPCTGR